MQRPWDRKESGRFGEQKGDWRECQEVGVLAELREEHELSSAGPP